MPRGGTMRNSSKNIAEIALVELYFAYAELSAEDPAIASGARAVKHVKQAIKNLESITRGHKKAGHAKLAKAA